MMPFRSLVMIASSEDSTTAARKRAGLPSSAHASRRWSLFGIINSRSNESFCHYTTALSDRRWGECPRQPGGRLRGNRIARIDELNLRCCPRGPPSSDFSKASAGGPPEADLRWVEKLCILRLVARRVRLDGQPTIAHFLCEL